MPLLIASNEQPIRNGTKYVPNSNLEIPKHVSEMVIQQGSPVKSRKAKRIRFLANGDRFSKGVVMAITPERYRSFDSLLNELTRSLSNNVNLATGVRVIYTMDGRKISNLEELEDGKFYVCSGLGDTFKRVDYTSSLPHPSKIKPARSFTRLSSPNNVQQQQPSPKGTNNSVRPRIIIVVRNGNRPRKVFRLLLSKRNAPSFDHALSNITELVKLDTGAVRKIFSSQGIQVTTLEGLFDTEDVFFAYGSERINTDDFELDNEEMKSIQSLTKGLRKNGGDTDKFGCTDLAPSDFHLFLHLKSFLGGQQLQQ